MADLERIIQTGFDAKLKKFSDPEVDLPELIIEDGQVWLPPNVHWFQAVPTEFLRFMACATGFNNCATASRTELLEASKIIHRLAQLPAPEMLQICVFQEGADLQRRIVCHRMQASAQEADNISGVPPTNLVPIDMPKSTTPIRQNNAKSAGRRGTPRRRAASAQLPARTSDRYVAQVNSPGDDDDDGMFYDADQECVASLKEVPRAADGSCPATHVGFGGCCAFCEKPNGADACEPGYMRNRVFKKNAEGKDVLVMDCCIPDPALLGKVTIEPEQLIETFTGQMTNDQMKEVLENTQDASGNKLKTTEIQRLMQEFKDQKKTLQEFLQDPEVQKIKDIYRLLEWILKVQITFGSLLTLQTERMNKYFSTPESSSNARNIGRVVWENVKWVGGAFWNVLSKTGRYLISTYLHMLLYHPALLRMFIYAAVQMKNDICQNLSWKIQYVDHRAVFDHFRKSGEVLLNYAKLASKVVIEDWLKSNDLFLLSQEYIGGVFDWVVSSVLVFATSGASSVLRSVAIYGVNLACRSMAEAVKYELHTKNMSGALMDTYTLFFDWSDCVRKIMVQVQQQHDILPCPDNASLMCYARDLTAKSQRKPVEGKGTLMRWVPCKDDKSQYCYEEIQLDMAPCKDNASKQCMRELMNAREWSRWNNYLTWKSKQPEPCKEGKDKYCINGHPLMACPNDATRLCKSPHEQDFNTNFGFWPFKE